MHDFCSYSDFQKKYTEFGSHLICITPALSVFFPCRWLSPEVIERSFRYDCEFVHSSFQFGYLHRRFSLSAM